MVLDINLFREEKGGNVEALRKQVRERYRDVRVIDDVVNCDVRWREKRFQSDACNRLVKMVSLPALEYLRRRSAMPCTGEQGGGREDEGKGGAGRR